MHVFINRRATEISTYKEWPVAITLGEKPACPSQDIGTGTEMIIGHKQNRWERNTGE